MYAITCINEKQKDATVIDRGRVCVFVTKKEAVDYQTNTLVPHIIEMMEHGSVVGKSMFGKKKYQAIPLEEKRKYTKMMETILIRPVVNFVYGKVR